MKVRLIQEMSGLRDGQPWPAVGTVVELPDAEAADLIRAQGAELPEADEPPAPRADVPEKK